MLRRFLEHIGPAERDTLLLLAVPNGFDLDLFDALLRAFPTGYSLLGFRRLCGYSFIETTAVGEADRYALHLLLREHLLADLDPARRAGIEAFLFDWFDARCQPATPRYLTAAHEAAFREAVYHRDTGDAVAASYGPEHPLVAIGLHNLAALLQATDRLAEAEPLMRRALAIDEASYGPGHPAVARDLGNLAAMFSATNRLAETEPLMRRALIIWLAFNRDTGHPHPHLRVGLGNYLALLSARGLGPEAIGEHVAALFTEAGLGPAQIAALRDALG